MSYREKKQTPPNRQEKRLERKNCCVSHVCKMANSKFLHVRIRKHFSIDWYNTKVIFSFACAIQGIPMSLWGQHAYSSTQQVFLITLLSNFWTAYRLSRRRIIQFFKFNLRLRILCEVARPLQVAGEPCSLLPCCWVIPNDLLILGGLCVDIRHYLSRLPKK